MTGYEGEGYWGERPLFSATCWIEVPMRDDTIFLMGVTGGRRACKGDRSTGTYIPVVVDHAWCDLHHKHPGWADASRTGNVLDELRDKRFSRHRVAQKYPVGEMRPRSVQDRVIHLYGEQTGLW